MDPVSGTVCLIAVAAIVGEALLLGGTVAIGNSEAFHDAAESIGHGIRDGGRAAAGFVEETIVNGSTETYPLEERPDPYSIPGPTLGATGPNILANPLPNEPVTFGLDFPSNVVELPNILASEAKPDDILVRRGTGWESTSRLNRQALAAEAAGFPHGVSVTTPASNARLSNNPLDASQALRRAFEQAGFPVHYTPTRNDPYHHTVELPKPVTPADATNFNEVLGRGR